MKDRKEKKSWVLILFIVLIMIGTSVSFVFFGFGPQNEIVKYNDIKFVKNQQSVWIAKIDGKEAAFSFLPDDIKDIPFNSPEKLQNKLEIDATYDFNSTYKEAIALAQHQMGLTLAQYNVFVRNGFTANNTFNLPIITCDDATQNVPVVYFKYGNLTKIYTESNCLIAEAKSNQDFIRTKDRLLYGILGVVK